MNLWTDISMNRTELYLSLLSLGCKISTSKLSIDSLYHILANQFFDEIMSEQLFTWLIDVLIDSLVFAWLPRWCNDIFEEIPGYLFIVIVHEQNIGAATWYNCGHDWFPASYMSEQGLTLLDIKNASLQTTTNTRHEKFYDRYNRKF